jgi:hypothetical protein
LFLFFRPAHTGSAARGSWSKSERVVLAGRRVGSLGRGPPIAVVPPHSLVINDALLLLFHHQLSKWICGWGSPMAVRLATHSSIMALGPHMKASMDDRGSRGDAPSSWLVPSSLSIADCSCGAPIRPFSMPAQEKHSVTLWLGQSIRATRHGTGFTEVVLLGDKVLGGES